MIPELGHFALLLAAVLALAQCGLPLLGAARGVRAWSGLAGPLALLQFGFILLAFSCLAWAFAGNDFSVAVVATHSHTQLPLPFRLAATWGSHPGSLLLWVLMLSGWSVAVARCSRRLPAAMVARALGVLGGVSVAFLSFLLLTSNPFERLLPAPLQGRDLNPLLQDWGMVIHPPMLYMGYVGFSVAFAFAIAALLGKRLDAAWARAARPWATAAWCFLTAGIALGSWWAYRELGWGGWWFWDPVENASFMPWLVGTALIHSLAVADRRGALLGWTVLLAIGAFSLSLLGTFLVRSGVLTSVHAFAADPARGVYLLAILALVVGGSLALFATRAPQLAPAGGGGHFDAVSRETLLMANNVLLMAAAGTVLLGTLYPLVLDVLGAGRISVGTPYFETVLVPLLAPLAFLMGLGPLARWKRASLPELATRLKWAFTVSVCVAVLLPAALGGGSVRVSLGLLLASWVVAGSVVNLYGRVAGAQPHATGAGAAPPASLARRLAAQPLGYYGMLIAHCGLAVFIAGVTGVKGFETERELRMAVGQSVSIGADDFRFMGASDFRGPNYEGVRGVVELRREGRHIDTLYPERRHYGAQGSTMTEAAIHSGLFGDRYVALGEPLGDARGGAAWSLRVHVKPLIGWIWGGCLIMVLGGLLALADRRYRLAARQPAPAPRAAAPAPALACAPACAPAAEGRRAALVLLLAAPCAAGLMYARLGNPAALAPPLPLPQEAAQALVDRMMAHLVSHLAEQPGDLDGWRLLARSYEAMERFPEAAKAYAKLAELQPARSAAQADALADQADALSMAQAGRFAGAPMVQVSQALLIDPDNRKALAMAGNEAFERQDYAGALGYWERLRAAAPAGSALAKSLDAQIASAQEVAERPAARVTGDRP